MALKALVLKVGECAALPSSVTVTGVAVDGDGQVSSSCGNVPSPVSYVCYGFAWENDSDGSMQDAIFVSLAVGGNTYMVPSAYGNINHTSGDTLGPWINSDPQLTGIVQFVCENHSPDHELVIRIPAGLDAPILTISNPYASTSTTFLMQATLTETCDCP